jgi:hypothetical protein
MTQQPARLLAEPLAARARGPTKVGTHPPSTWRIVQSEIDPTAPRLLVAGGHHGAADSTNAIVDGASVLFNVVVTSQVECLAHALNISFRKERPNVHLKARRFRHCASRKSPLGTKPPAPTNLNLARKKSAAQLNYGIACRENHSKQEKLGKVSENCRSRSPPISFTDFRANHAPHSAVFALFGQCETGTGKTTRYAMM